MEKKYSAVIFDLDGTLLDTIGDLAAACNKTLAAMGLPCHNVEEYKLMVGKGIKNLVENMLPPQNRKLASLELALELFEKNYTKNMTKLTAPYPGINELLQELKREGIKLAVLSNKAHRLTLELTDKYFPNIFDCVMGLTDSFPQKPDAASALYIMEQIGAAAGHTLYCGDSNVDMQTAANAGLDACGVLWGFRSKEELINAGANCLAENAEELGKIIFGEI